MNVSLQKNWLFNTAFTAFLYLACSFIGLELTSSTSIASFFMPSSGIALGAIFMFGPIALVGIILGSLFSHIFLFGNTQALSLLTILAPALQAYITFRVLHPLFSHSFSLISERHIVQFFTFAPLFSFISSSISVLYIYITQDISSAQLFTTWLICWVGNSFGVLIVTPLFFALFSQQDEWQKRRLSLSIPLIALTFVSISIMQFSQQREDDQLTQRLYQTNRIFNTEVNNILNQYEKNLHAINIFFLSTYHATPNEIKGFLKKLNLKKNDIAYGYGWFGFADLMNTKSESQYTFYTLKPYPFTLKSNPLNVIQEQFEACTIGSYLEVHAIEKMPQTLYRNIEASISSIENLCASEHLGGVAYVDIDLNHLFSEVSKRLNIEHIRIQLIGTKNNQPTVLFSSIPTDNSKVVSIGAPVSESLITYKNTFWTLKLTADQHYVSQHSDWSTWWLFLISLLMTSISGLGLLSLTAKKLHTESIVDKKSIQLQRINNQLSEQVQQQQQQEILIKMQSRILEMIAKDEPLEKILDQLCIYAENQVFEGASASISSYDKSSQKMTLAASPNLPSATEDYFSKLDVNTSYDPSVDALKTQKQQIVKQLDGSLSTRLSNTQSYWATPIVSHQEEILGVLTITLSKSRSPNAQEQQLMSVTAALACISFERHNNNKQLNKLSNAVESSPNGIVITSLKGVIEYANPYFCHYIGVSEDDLKGQLLSQHVQDASDANQQDFDWDYCLSLGESQREYMGIKPNGDVYWCKQTIASMFDKHQNSQHVLSIHQDITDEHTAHQFLMQQASHDSLTGLFNYTEFKFQLNKLIERPHKGQNHTVAHLDLDGFKAINDQCGHTAGDQLLRSISDLLEKQLRKTDFLARVGGDEFGIILEQCPAKKSKAILNGLLQAIADYEFIWDNKTFQVGASVGLVEINEKEIPINDVLKNVQTACYLAKEGGKQHVYLYHTNDLEKQIDVIKHDWQKTLTQALEKNHFVLFIQPIKHLEKNSIEQYEVLLRLHNERNDIIPSSRFINDAERLNLMPKIDRWVITKVFEWMNQNPSLDSNFSINLSGQTIDITFFPWLKQMIEKHQIESHRLCFEITEQVAIVDFKKIQTFIQSLNSLGCTSSLEDFGCGLSSFSYLKDLDVDYVKLDAQIVKTIEHNIIDRAMVKAINEIIHIIGKKTIADYTANNATHDILKAIGVDFIQGASVAPPFKLKELSA